MKTLIIFKEAQPHIKQLEKLKADHDTKVRFLVDNYPLSWEQAEQSLKEIAKLS